MGFLGIGDVIESVVGVLSPQKKQEVEQNIIALVKSQTDVNLAEASHPSVLVAGARPSVIWVGSLGLLWNTILQPLFVWGWVISGHSAASAPPAVDGTALTGLVTAMLGVAGMRSIDKFNGVETNQINLKAK